MYQPIKFLKNWFDYYRNTEDEELLYDIDGLPVDLQLPFSSVSTEDEIFVSPDNKCYNCKEVVDDIVIGPHNNFWCSRCYTDYFVIFRFPYFK